MPYEAEQSLSNFLANLVVTALDNKANKIYAAVVTCLIKEAEIVFSSFAKLCG